ncbi:hypothetical protein [Rhizobium sp. BR 362]|uniref:hypothetical protein n=1 Tax=Rhizobium sp. BR 362 TaxID=3040670 RepID=UPI002F421D33
MRDDENQEALRGFQCFMIRMPAFLYAAAVRAMTISPPLIRFTDESAPIIA